MNGYYYATKAASQNLDTIMMVSIFLGIVFGIIALWAMFSIISMSRSIKEIRNILQLKFSSDEPSDEPAQAPQQTKMTRAEIQREFLNIAEEYSYPESTTDTILDNQELMKKIVEAKLRGIAPDKSWLETTLQNDK